MVETSFGNPPGVAKSRLRVFFFGSKKPKRGFQKVLPKRYQKGDKKHQKTQKMRSGNHLEKTTTKTLKKSDL